MRFDLVDAVLEISADRIVAVKQVTAAEEYLGDHFPGFPVLPGVMMIEAMVQAARRLLERREAGGRLVLGGVRGLKYGGMVRPGDALRVEVALAGEAGGVFEFKGAGTVVKPGGASAPDAGRNAVAGRFSLRPIRLGVG